jgi:hypothetical protein
MKKPMLLFAALTALAGAGCDEDPTLAEALDDLVAAAPGACVEYCNPLVDCEWQNLGNVTGPESGNLLGDTKAQCVVDCAFRADHGVYYYEYDWDAATGEPIYTMKGTVPGDLAIDYLGCLIDAALWLCVDLDEAADDEMWAYRIDDATAESCAAYSACTALLDINLEFEWNPAGNEGAGDCQASGDEFLWGAW